MTFGLTQIPQGGRTAVGALALLAVSYYLGAEAAFYVGTLSDRIFAPFWPPNIILFCALLVTPKRHWWLCIAAVFPAHVVAELRVGMPPAQYLVAFATNCAVATLNAYGVLRFIGGPNCFDTLRNAATYVSITVIFSPAIVALGGALVPLMSEGEIKSYWVSWAYWYSANALGSATLGPVLLTWVCADPRQPPLTAAAKTEAVALLVGLIAACAIAFGAGLGTVPAAFLPTLLYLPVPFVLWAALRFGDKGASAAILVVTIVSISRNLNGSTMFDGDNTEQSVLALQVFLTVFSIPVLLLGATMEELRHAKSRMQELAGSLLRVQDEERRRIAKELHDSMGQNLVGARLLVSRLQSEAPNSSGPINELNDILQGSIQELRTISYLLHPPLLDEAGLGLALRSYINGFSERSGIAVDLILEPAMQRLPGEIELALFRVIQEALTNVYHHSGSHTARIRLAIQGADDAREAVVTVEDFGQGMAGTTRLSILSADTLASAGLGLQGMRERLRQIGGRFDIKSALGGTTIIATVPLAARESL